MLEKSLEAIRAEEISDVELRKGDFTDLSAFADYSVEGIMSLQAIHHSTFSPHGWSQVKRVKPKIIQL